MVAVLGNYILNSLDKSEGVRYYTGHDERRQYDNNFLVRYAV
jgi:hypothetical protein